MRYIDGDSAFIVAAETIFERLIGYSLAETEYEETIRRDGRLFTLKQTPFLRLIDVKGRTEAWEYVNYFGVTGWQSVPIEYIATYVKDGQAHLETPPSALGDPYTELKVVYKAGIGDVPSDVQNAIQAIATLLERREITEWSFTLPDDVLNVIESYRKEVE